MSLRDLLRERTKHKARPATTLIGGPSFAYVFGWVLVMLLGIQAVTGAALAAFYSPSATSAWASVAYVQDKMALGWLVRGLHFHGGSALAIVSGLHLVQTALWGAYKKPRELVWWLGILLLLLLLAFAITGYVLRWDQAGYWANRVEVGIAAGTPVIGDLLRKLVIGGNEYGNLTLTRFYALHVIVLPALVTVLAIGHVVLARRHGATPRWGKDAARGVAWWPVQSIRNALAMAVVFAALLAYTVSQHGADLAAPADASAAYDARPLWYFRWLFELRAFVGSFERFALLAAPAIVAGFLVALPVLDRGVDRSPRRRLPWVGGVVGLCALITALTAASLASDAGDAGLAKRQAKADQAASRARALAAQYGVPVTGAQDVATLQPMYRARYLFEQRCGSCHDADGKDRKGPVITAGHGSRAWFRGFFAKPSGDAYWGKTKLGATDDAMKPVELPPADLDDLAEAIYAQSGAADVDSAKADRGKAIFDKACTDCHSIDDGVAGASGPGLGTLGSRDWYTHFIGNPKAPIHMGPDRSQMPRFDRELSIVDRDALAGYLGWLRTATPQDLAKLGPL